MVPSSLAGSPAVDLRRQRACPGLLPLASAEALADELCPLPASARYPTAYGRAQVMVTTAQLQRAAGVPAEAVLADLLENLARLDRAMELAHEVRVRMERAA